MAAVPADTLQLQRAAKELSASRSWEALREGRIVGTARSEGLSRYEGYKDFGTQHLIGGLPAFASGPRSYRFASWSEAPRRRPVALVSTAPHGDPQGWRATRPVDAPDAELVRLIRSSVTDLAPCDEESSGDKLRLTARDLRAAEAYESRNGDRLVAFVVRKGANVCNGFGGAAVGPFWFFARHHGARRFVGDRMTMIERADLDGDGATEFLFWHSGYDLDGYRVYWDDFTRSAEFSWNYH
jgi:hypothetical protein